MNDKGKSYIDGSVAFVTGAGRGIGRALALDLARRGAAVACLARSEDQVRETLGLIEAEGGKGIACKGDVTDLADMREWFERTGRELGPVRIVIANAGTNLDRRSVEDSVPGDFEETLKVNVVGVYNTVKAAVPFLKKGGGHIILIGSGQGLRGQKNGAAYACSKAGVHILTQVLSLELKPYSIAVNEFIPGPVKTELTRPLWEKKAGVFAIEDEWIKNPEDTGAIPMALLSYPPDSCPSGQTYSLTRRVL
jgi:3-oxoacyl-[acyl-carrier protein] reductase